MTDETNRTVTISADYFAELFVKAKLDNDATANGLSPATQKLLETEQRLAVAERCIEDIDGYCRDCDYSQEDTLRKINDIIRAWREKREAEGEMRKPKDIYIVYDGVRYRLVKGLDCTNHCSFRKADGPYLCERGCYLPKWFTDLKIGVDCWLERVDPKVELLHLKKKGGAK